MIIVALIRPTRYKTERLATSTSFRIYTHSSSALYRAVRSIMGLPWYAWVFLVWCTVNSHGYNVERLEDDQSQTYNFDIDSFSSIENNKFLDLDKQTPVEPIRPVYNLDSTRPPGAAAQKHLYLFFVTNDNYTGANNETTPLDSWSVVWYIASFGGLIVFFLIVSCSEWCCRRAIRNNQQNCRNAPVSAPSVPDTPPPSYEQFAPPSYESICLGRNANGEKSEYDIYVVPVHTLGTLVESRHEDAPPSYLSASGGVVQNNRVARVT